MQQGQGPGLPAYSLGEQGGSSTITLLTSEIPAHTHTANAPVANASSTAGNSTLPTGKVWARYGREGGYSNAAADTQMAAGVNLAVNPVGGNLPHENMLPYLALNFVIAMQGIFPPRP
jgi:microcystin-dependent protein